MFIYLSNLGGPLGELVVVVLQLSSDDGTSLRSVLGLPVQVGLGVFVHGLDEDVLSSGWVTGVEFGSDNDGQWGFLFFGGTKGVLLVLVHLGGWSGWFRANNVSEQVLVGQGGFGG
ncbi:hypothetical protein WICPIJ_002351 [Wickerhamomyces pijperi]|uniref:Uncharacterized protein n=1 Tax=Wickerhamomyces pijperi TaxID=599730 RepID=A0A9P8QBX3_WICPI|nr:hypothetical protein WICPIJ_002351 [Wickerhamomyces pijperi]